MSPAPLRIVVDRVLCQGHGVCEGEAPEVFSVSKQGELTILDETPDESLRPQVEAAVKYCPTHALRLAEAGSEAGGVVSETESGSEAAAVVSETESGSEAGASARTEET